MKRELGIKSRDDIFRYRKKNSSFKAIKFPNISPSKNRSLSNAKLSVITSKMNTIQHPILKKSKANSNILGCSPLIPQNFSNPTILSTSERIDQHTLVNMGVTSKTWCIYDSRCKKVLGFRQCYNRQVASLTKIMTTVLCLQLIQSLNLSLNIMVRITKLASAMIGTTAELRANTYLSIQDLLYGAMLPSGNDAAYSLAEYFGYFITLCQQGTPLSHDTQSLDLTNSNTNNYVHQFISCMNQKAFQLNLIGTRFSNPHGLQNAMNLSSAKDIAILSAKATKHTLFRRIMSTADHRYQVYQNNEWRKKTVKKWRNTNKLLDKDWQGVKTGQTTSAGSCLASLKEGVFIVVLNCSNPDTRFSDTQKIYSWYINQKESEDWVKRVQVSNINTRRIKTQFSQNGGQTTLNSL